jgi:hypothetical protein
MVVCFSNLGAVNVHREKERASCLDLSLCNYVICRLCSWICSKLCVLGMSEFSSEHEGN